MRLLPVLLFVLSTIPLRATLKCYTEVKMEKEIESTPNAEREEKTCHDSADKCVKAVGVHAIGGNFTARGCPSLECMFLEGCMEENTDGNKLVYCCCKGDLCNPTAVNSVLIPLTAVAFVILMRIQ
ncbi:hypothetical protein PRIPAC_89461 [Pristionchus pacificus]|uniref:Uncharacterized protein n=1 Tax=Pristionchus pacificus TaxID=54126 RepID=A0A2A6B8J1_PRIPA|nr:hypothetical protein PRIPAC_89461 [Pristionchus pacificus]|eukprot:PDM62191.1 hypothetical protein PRIPAC_51633 [Pristionchus pacificus]